MICPRTALFAIVPLLLASAAGQQVHLQPAPPPAHNTQVVVLGSGNPGANPDRFGPAVMIVAHGQPYLVDCGVGVVRRIAASRRSGVKLTGAPHIVFITHLHSDHTLGLPDLALSPWVLGRTEPLEAYGPIGLKNMAAAIETAWQKDIDIRIHGLEQANTTGYRIVVHEIPRGNQFREVYRDANITVTAFPVKHGTWDEALGYRFQTEDRTIVISGDTAPTENIVKACDGCDLLLHEAYNPNGDQLKIPHWREYFATFHTSAEDLGRIATRAHPKLLVLYHQMFSDLPEDQLSEQLQKTYSGKFASARDLDVF